MTGRSLLPSSRVYTSTRVRTRALDYSEYQLIFTFAEGTSAAVVVAAAVAAATAATAAAALLPWPHCHVDGRFM